MGVGVGAGLGAVIGAIVCGADCAALGAAAGAAAGAVGGYMYANNIDKHHQELTGKEDDLHTQLKVAKNINAEMQAINQNIQAKIAELDQDVSSLQAEDTRQASIKKELEAKKQQIDDEISNVQSALASAEKELESITAFRSSSAEGEHSKELDTEYIKLVESVEKMKEHSPALAPMSQRI